MPIRPFPAPLAGADDRDCLTFYQSWLTDNHLIHGPASRSRFAHQYPLLFGRALELMERGYGRWLKRTGGSDTAQAFAGYCAPRYRRRQSALRARANRDQRSALRRKYSVVCRVDASDQDDRR